MSSPKLQRWTDLLAALLIRRHPATFDDLAHDVPAYLLKPGASPAQKATVKRMFERDKAELLTFGIPLATVLHDDEILGYSLRPATFYLPYLALQEAGGRARPARRVDKYGYHALTQLAFEPDQLSAIAAAAGRAQSLGEPQLAAAARAAIRKLNFDLPQANAQESTEVFLAREKLQPDVFPALNQGLLSRKRVTFTYDSMAAGSAKRRTVAPLGLFFLSSHWYLAAAEGSEPVVKNFRLSRMRGVSVNQAKPQTPDFAVPPSFSLRAHSRSRQAWELGDSDSLDAVVEFSAITGAVLTALELGAAVKDQPAQRAFKVRRVDAFARWLMGFAGAACPVSPPALVERFRQAVTETLALYGPRP